MRLQFDRPTAPQSPLSLERIPTPFGREQVTRSLSKLREECEIQAKRALQRHRQGETGPEAVQQVTDARIRTWLQKQLQSHHYSEAYMEASRSERHPCGDVTLVARDGVAVTFIHPTSVLGFHYLLSDIKKALPVRVFCAPEIAERMQTATSQLSDLGGLLQESWPISSKPAVGLVPVELDPKAFTEQVVLVTETSLAFKPRVQKKTKSEGIDPTLDSPHQLERVRIGHPIQLLDPEKIAQLVLKRPTLRSNTEFV